MDRHFENAISQAAPAAPAAPNLGFPTSGNPAAAIPATSPGAWWFYAITEEMRNAILAAGIDPEFASTNQLAAALLKIKDDHDASDAAHPDIRELIWRNSGGTAQIKKLDNRRPCLEKTGATTLAIKAGTCAFLPAGEIYFPTATAADIASLTPGEDYSVWVLPDGTACAIADSIPYPAEEPAEGALKIGGFHYGLTAPGSTMAGGSFAVTGQGMIWTQDDVDLIAGINAHSIWDLTFRPLCDPRGMTCVTDPTGRGLFWFDIYFCGTDHVTLGTSRYNSDVASGTVLPKIPPMFGGDGTVKYTRLSTYEALEIAMAHGKRLWKPSEFYAAAFGVTEKQSLGGASTTIPATTRLPGYTSRYGGEQMTGHHWAYGDAQSFLSINVTGNWQADPGRGSAIYGPSYCILGGSREYGSNSGSRCSVWNYPAWNSYWTNGVRAVCDHLNLI